MGYSAVALGTRYTFHDLKTLLAKASPARSGDQLAGIAASSATERAAACMALADVPLTDFLAEPLIPYERDEVTRLIFDTHDSLGTHLTWHPALGRTDAERNCISNIRPEGLGYREAADRIFALAREARRRQLTGVALKEDRGAPAGTQPKILDKP